MPPYAAVVRTLPSSRLLGITTTESWPARAAAAATARQTFAEDGAGEALPAIDVSRGELAGGIPAFELFRRAGLAASGGEARRLIKGGGARLNNAPVAGETRAVTLADADETGRLKLSAGKKRHALVRIV